VLLVRLAQLERLVSPDLHLILELQGLLVLQDCKALLAQLVAQLVLQEQQELDLLGHLVQLGLLGLKESPALPPHKGRLVPQAQLVGLQEPLVLLDQAD
jgi:hypothetical protein